MRFPSESASFFCALGVKFIKTLGAYFAISHMLSALDADSPDSSENRRSGKLYVRGVSICDVSRYSWIG